MQKMDEKQAFSARLRQALARNSKKSDSATELALQFNLRYMGEGITPQAAQKWLNGKARPTSDKIDALAEWLNVSSTWLKHGIASSPPAVRHLREPEELVPTEEEISILRRLRALPAIRRGLVLELLEQFALDEAVWTDTTEPR